MYVPNTRQMGIRVRGGRGVGRLAGRWVARRVGRWVGRRPGWVARWVDGWVARWVGRAGRWRTTREQTNTQTNKHTNKNKYFLPSRSPFPIAPKDQTKPFGHPLTLILCLYIVFIYSFIIHMRAKIQNTTSKNKNDCCLRRFVPLRALDRSNTSRIGWNTSVLAPPVGPFDIYIYVCLVKH